jgi:excisionase family DNA binding protein
MPKHKRPTQQPPLTITISEAARRLGIGRSLAYAAAASGEIPTIRIGTKALRVPVRALERMLDAGTSKIEAAE